MQTIGILTSGGDSPGMNTAIRAITLRAINAGIRVIGIKRGYAGLLEEEMINLDHSAVQYIADWGGTILMSSRCKEMKTEEGQIKAAKICQKHKIDGLIVIGGDGSITGASKLADLGVNTIGIPGTIDLDLPCTQYTIGFDTAVNTVIDALGKIRDTSFSHERCSVVEVMGRHSGWIAIWAAIASGAEQVLAPEFDQEVDLNGIISKLKKAHNEGKKDHLIVLGEGLANKLGNAFVLAQEIEKNTLIETRGTILGHIQRGGSPSAVDRMHASMMGIRAVELLIEGMKNRIVVYRDGQYGDMDIIEALSESPSSGQKLYQAFNLLTI